MSSGKCGARETSYYVDAQLPNHFFECSLVISRLPPHTSAGKRCTRFRQTKRRTGAMTPYNFVLPRCLSLRDKRGRHKEGLGGKIAAGLRPSQ